MKRLRPLVVLWIAIPIGCADGAAIYDRSVEYAHIPAAHPSAPESPFVPPPLLAPGTSPAASAEPPPGEVIYTCPMHPEIVSDAPSKCPKCGMALVPRPKPKGEGEGAPGHQHHQHRGTP